MTKSVVLRVSETNRSRARLKWLGIVALLPYAMLLASCANVHGECGVGLEVAPDGTCQEPCQGGTVESGVCTCPFGQVLVDGVCRKEEDKRTCEEVVCGDENECTRDSCHVVDGQAKCVFERVENGFLCSHTPQGDEGSGTCQAGVCILEPDPCPDGGCECEVAADCQPVGDCAVAACVDGVCEDGGFQAIDTPCGSGGFCDGAGTCVECTRNSQCGDGNFCTDDSCELTTGLCVYADVTDGSGGCAFQGGEGACKTGVCVAPPQACIDNPCADDGETCTDTVCTPTADGSGRTCTHPPKSTSPRCTTDQGYEGQCEVGVCEGLCEGVSCKSTIACIEDGTCDPTTGRCIDGPDSPKDTDCSDGGNFCDGAGNCVECTTASHCTDDDPSNVCTGVACISGSCEPIDTTNPCTYQGGDGLCNGGECTDADNCDPNPCADLGVCVQCTCDDGNATYDNTVFEGRSCTTATSQDGECSNGTCKGLCEGVDCSSTNECVADGVCNPETGNCEPGDPFEAGLRCGNNDQLYCDGAGTCVPCIADDNCDNPDPGNICTKGVCVNGSCATGHTSNDCDLPGEAGTCEQGLCKPAHLCAGVICPDYGDPCVQWICDKLDGECRPNAIAPGRECLSSEGWCDAEGYCAACRTVADCPIDNDVCTARSCNDGVCGNDNAAPSGTACDVGGFSDECVSGACEKVNGDWGEKIQVSAGAGVTKKVLVTGAGSGKAVAVWYKGSTLQSSQFSATRGWSKPKTLDSNAVTNRGLALDSDEDGNAIALSVRQTNTGYQILAWRYSPVSSEWGSSPAVLSKDRALASSPRLAIAPNGDTVAVWVDFTTVYGRRSKTTNTFWGGAVRLSPSDNFARGVPATALADNGKGATVFGSFRSTGERDTLYENRHGNSGFTGFQTEIDKSSGRIEGVDIAASDDGEMVAVWEQGDDIWVNHFRQLQWQGADRIDIYNSAAFGPKVEADKDGNYIVLWSHERGIRTRRLPANSTTWENQKTPSDSATAQTGAVAKRAELAFAPNGDAVAVWLHGDYIWRAVYRKSLNRWDFPAEKISSKLASSADENATAPQVSISSDRTVVVVWTDGTATQVMSWADQL